jgi:fructose-bisphosphate aldolase class II
MPLVHTGELLQEAVAGGIGLAAFNVINLENAEAIVEAAEETRLPAVLQVSENCIRYHRGQVRPLMAGLAAMAGASDARVSLHLDHIEVFHFLENAAGTGVSSAMFDASKLDIAENIAATRRAVSFAKTQGWHLEAELGEVGGKDGAHAPGVRTDPAEAAAFVESTGVDSLAVAVGSSHAMTAQTALLDHDLIRRINAAVDVPLVLHGSSGVPAAELALAINAGMVKINIGTMLNIAFTEAVREALEAPELVDPRKYLAPARTRTAGIVRGALKAIAMPRIAPS